MHQSSIFQYYFIKYGLVYFGLLFYIIPFILVTFKLEITSNGMKENATFENMIPCFILALVSITIGIYMKSKTKLARISNSEIELSDYGYHRKSSWQEIERIRMIRFVAPPLFSVKFKDEEKSHYFVSQNWFVWLGFFTWDLSEMGKLIKRKKIQLGI